MIPPSRNKKNGKPELRRNNSQPSRFLTPLFAPREEDGCEAPTGLENPFQPQRPGRQSQLPLTLATLSPIENAREGPRAVQERNVTRPLPCSLQGLPSK